MLESIVLSIRVFLFIISIMVILSYIAHVAFIFTFKVGKLNLDTRSLVLFGTSVAYIITRLICGF